MFRSRKITLGSGGTRSSRHIHQFFTIGRNNEVHTHYNFFQGILEKDTIVLVIISQEN